MISTKDFVHKQDERLTNKIFKETPFQSWMDKAYEHSLDKVCEYVYSASLPEIHDKSIIKMRNSACEKFGVDIFKIYLNRNYEYDIDCVGYNSPAILISSNLLKCNDEEILQARIYAAAAAIAAGHNKLSFFIWIAENMSGAASIPIIKQAIIALLYEWNRTRQFSLDRAVLLATENYELALKNILYGVIPFEILQNFQFGKNDDTFLEQVHRYFKNDDPTQIIGKIFSYFSDYSWLPRRYDELVKFHNKLTR